MRLIKMVAAYEHTVQDDRDVTTRWNKHHLRDMSGKREANKMIWFQEDYNNQSQQ